MKPLILIASIVISGAASAQTAMPEGYQHPVMPGHESGTMPHGGAGQYRFQPNRPAGLPALPTPKNAATVISEQTFGGYSYIEANTANGSIWLAAPPVTVKEGDAILYPDGAIMRNFNSKAMGRTFPAIIFVNEVILASDAPKTSATASAAAPAPHSMAMPGSLPPVEDSNEGSVISSQNAGGYSYIEIKTDEGTTWLAAPMVALKPGNAIRYEGGAPMQNFTSRSLNRTFPTILFVDRVTVIPAK